MSNATPNRLTRLVRAPFWGAMIALALVLTQTGCGPSSMRKHSSGKDAELTGGTTADGRAHTAGSDQDDELVKMKARINGEKSENKSLTTAIHDLVISRLDEKGNPTDGIPSSVTLVLRFKADSGYPESLSLSGRTHQSEGATVADLETAKDSPVPLRASLACRGNDCETITLLIQKTKVGTLDIEAEAGVVVRRQKALVQSHVVDQPGLLESSTTLGKIARDFKKRGERILNTVEVAWGISRFSLDLSQNGVCPSGLLVQTNDEDEGINLTCAKQSEKPSELHGTLLGNNNRGSLLLRMSDGTRTLYLAILGSDDALPEAGEPTAPPSPTSPTSPTTEPATPPTLPPPPPIPVPEPRPAPPAASNAFIPVDPSHPITKAWERDRERKEIKTAIEEWTKSKRLKAFLKRAHPNLPVMLEAMRAHKVPNETIFITMIESLYFVEDGYPVEVSSSGAVGPWQFVPSTASWDFIGLTVMPLLKGTKGSKAHPCDERADLKKSSYAAGKYFAYLYKSFPNDPKLGIMSYNWGKNHVNDALRELRERQDGRLNEIKRMGFDFWSVKEFNLAPLESINYVIKFVSGQFVGREPSRYGIELGDAKSNTYPKVETPTQCSDGGELVAGP